MSTHDHSQTPQDFNRAFLLGLALNVALLVGEVVFGVLSNSLALLSDAGHNATDVLALVLAWGALALSRRAATSRRTYGWRRSSILAALANAITLLVVTGGIAWEALHRIAAPQPVAGVTVVAVAAAGVVVNAAAAMLFLSGRGRDMNIRGAFLHLASDAVVSLGVVVAGVAMLITGQLWLDPLASLIVAAVILWSTWGLFKETLNLALDAVPQEIDLNEVRSYLLSLPSVVDVHDLHVWAMSTTHVALTAHLVMTERAGDAVLARVTSELHDRFEIDHATLQIEDGNPEYPCILAAPDVV